MYFVAGKRFFSSVIYCAVQPAFSTVRGHGLTVSSACPKRCNGKKLCGRHAERLPKRRAGFCILRGVLYKGTAPEQKTKSAKTAQLCGFSAFSVFFIIQRFYNVLRGRKAILFFRNLLRGPAGFFDSQRTRFDRVLSVSKKV